MKFLVTTLMVFLSIICGQDRSLIFTTGAPDGTDGHSIYWNGSSGNSISNRFHVDGNMVLEAIKLYAEAETEPAIANIILHTDNEGMPGEEIFSWNVNISEESHGNNYFLIITTDLCIYLEENNYYWLTLHASDTDSQINWFYSNNATFTYTTTNNQGASWESSQIGRCGALSIWAEYIYESEVNDNILGDLNSDGSVNVLDVVLLASGILNGNSIPEGDINGDSVNNVLDIVALVSIVLGGSSSEQLSTWEYVDINPNSIFFDQMVGPDIFNGNVSIYYFGKAG